MISGIEHFGLCATDTTALKDWYCKIFGWKVVYDNGKTPPTYFLKLLDGSMVEIYPAKSFEAVGDNTVSGWRHLALTSTDVMADAAYIEAQGGATLTEATITESGIGTYFFKDPQGNIVHLISRLSPL